MQPHYPGGRRAQRQQRDLVVDLLGAVLPVARSAGELGGEYLPCLVAAAAPHVGEQPPATDGGQLGQVTGFSETEGMGRDHHLGRGLVNEEYSTDAFPKGVERSRKTSMSFFLP